MPSPEVLQHFIAEVEANAHVEAIEKFYAPHASMQENELPPRIGRETLVFVNGDHVVIRWVFQFETHDGARIRMDELAYQRWEGDRIVEEKFFYDPQQLQPRR